RRYIGNTTYGIPIGTAGALPYVKTDSSGNVFVTGTGYNAAGYYIIVTLKYDPNGNLLWARHVDNSASGYYTTASGITIDSLDNVLVLGSYGNWMETVKYDTNGNRLWGQIAGTISTTYGVAIKTDSADNVYVSGNGYYGSPRGYDFLLVKYNAGG